MTAQETRSLTLTQLDGLSHSPCIETVPYITLYIGYALIALSSANCATPTEKKQRVHLYLTLQPPVVSQTKTFTYVYR